MTSASRSYTGFSAIDLGVDDGRTIAPLTPVEQEQIGKLGLSDEDCALLWSDTRRSPPHNIVQSPTWVAREARDVAYGILGMSARSMQNATGQHIWLILSKTFDQTHGFHSFGISSAVEHAAIFTLATRSSDTNRFMTVTHALTWSSQDEIDRCVGTFFLIQLGRGHRSIFDEFLAAECPAPFRYEQFMIPIIYAACHSPESRWAIPSLHKFLQDFLSGASGRRLEVHSPLHSVLSLTLSSIHKHSTR